MKFDLSKFKKIRSDKHTTTLAHPDGHEITVAHGALKPKLRADLAALPMAAAKHMMADGGPVVAEDPLAAIESPAPLASQLPVESPEQIAMDAAAPQASPEQPSMEAEAAAPQPAPPAAEVMPQAAPAETSPAPQPEMPQSAQPDLQHAYTQEQAATKAIGDTESTGAGKQAQVLDNTVKTLNDKMRDYQSKVDELNKERQGFIQDIKDHQINPNAYLGRMDTTQKITTAIGLILGGIGGAFGNGQNPASKFLNDQIDRDIDAQKANLGKKESLLSANMHQFGNLKDATEMTRQMMNDIVVDQLKQVAAKTEQPLAKERAMKAMADLEASRAPAFQQMAVNRMLIDANTKDQGAGADKMMSVMRVVNPEMAKEMESRYVPGVGMAKVPIPEKPRETLIAKQTLGTMARDLYKWSEQHSGSLDPKVINVGKTKAAQLQNLYRDSINGGVFKEGEQKFIDKVISSDPAEFFNNIRVLPSLREVIESNDRQLGVLKKAYGLPASGEQPQAAAPQQANIMLEWAKRNPQNPKAQAVLKKLGRS